MNSRELEQLRKSIIAIDARSKKRKRTKVSRKESRLLKDDIKECEECWSDKILQVHHIDKNAKNNDISNLQKLCLVCHLKKHEWDKVYRLMAKALKQKA